MKNWEKGVYLSAGRLATASHLFHAVASTFYEEGAALYTTPLLNLLFVTLFLFYLKWKKWAYKLSIWYAFWAVSINLVFRGQSTEYYGQMAVTMNNWELAEIFIAHFNDGV